MINNKSTFKKILKPVIALIFVLALLIIFYFSRQTIKPVTAPENPIGIDKAREIVKNILISDPEKDSLEAFLYPEIIEPGVQISSWDPDEPVKETKKYYYFAWIDRSPGNAFFAHPTEFIFIDAETGKYDKKDREFWPVIGEEPFEGSKDTLIKADEENSEPISFNIPKLNINDWIPSASAHAEGRYLHIETPDSDFGHEDYALIITGFGKNSWVFMEGAHDMYKALKNQGYDDDHIYFLAQGPVEIDSKWNRNGDPKLNRVEGVVDDVTSSSNIQKAFTAIGKRMTEKDSLFIFVLAHGSKKKLQVGRPLPDSILNDPETTIGEALYGRPDYIGSENFAKMSVGNIKACEVMVLFDSCYSGSQEPALKKAYNPKNIKRLQVAHSTDAKTVSVGADMRDPVDTRYPAVYDMDAKAKKTKIADPNPSDHGGEFSNGIIENLNTGLFYNAYSAGVQLDAANMNTLTHPYIWSLGESGSCDVSETLVDPIETPDTSQPEDPQPEATTPPKKIIKVIQYGSDYIPVSQLKLYPAKECNCCAEDHWHSISGSVKTVGGVNVTDPYKNCGFGTLKIKPAIEIEDPNNK